jgi:hypothetical protein
MLGYLFKTVGPTEREPRPVSTWLADSLRSLASIVDPVEEIGDRYVRLNDDDKQILTRIDRMPKMKKSLLDPEQIEAWIEIEDELYDDVMDGETPFQREQRLAEETMELRYADQQQQTGFGHFLETLKTEFDAKVADAKVNVTDQLAQIREAFDLDVARLNAHVTEKIAAVDHFIETEKAIASIAIDRAVEYVQSEEAAGDLFGVLNVNVDQRVERLSNHVEYTHPDATGIFGHRVADDRFEATPVNIPPFVARILPIPNMNNRPDEIAANPERGVREQKDDFLVAPHQRGDNLDFEEAFRTIPCFVHEHWRQVTYDMIHSASFQDKLAFIMNATEEYTPLCSEVYLTATDRLDNDDEHGDFHDRDLRGDLHSTGKLTREMREVRKYTIKTFEVRRPFKPAFAWGVLTELINMRTALGNCFEIFAVLDTRVITAELVVSPMLASQLNSPKTWATDAGVSCCKQNLSLAAKNNNSVNIPYTLSGVYGANIYDDSAAYVLALRESRLWRNHHSGLDFYKSASPESK